MNLPDWTGFDVVCIASGPSLRLCDAHKVQRWRFSGENRRVIVTNTTHTIAQWADILYAMDSVWWKRSTSNPEQFPGLKITGASRTTPNCPIAERVEFDQGGNSGAGAIMLARHLGAKKVILLGYDCKYADDGQRHWHGDHPKGLGNCESLPKFYKQFGYVAKQSSDIEIVNSSRESALDYWPRLELETALADTRR